MSGKVPNWSEHIFEMRSFPSRRKLTWLVNTVLKTWRGYVNEIRDETHSGFDVNQRV